MKNKCLFLSKGEEYHDFKGFHLNRQTISSSWKDVYFFYPCTLNTEIDTMVNPNSKCMPKTIECIMTKQTDNIFTLRECRIFLFYILNRKMNIIITPNSRWMSKKFKRIRNIQIDRVFILKGFGNHALLP